MIQRSSQLWIDRDGVTSDGLTGDGETALRTSPKGVKHHLESTKPNEERTCQQSKILRGIGHSETGSSTQNCSAKSKEKIKSRHIVS